PATDDWEPALVGRGGSDYLPLIGHVGEPASTPILLLGDSLATEPCRADLDGDGSLTRFDFLAFQNLFDSGDLAADFDGDGELTIFDFLEFQNEFVAGCP
ncbi:MAG: GC-type dockerin domain-anchored protein, partial [Phycisphaerales bacterium]